jgi:hypothetical protein
MKCQVDHELARNDQHSRTEDCDLIRRDEDGQQRERGEPSSLRFIVRAEPPSGERQQLGFEVRGNDFDVDAAEANTNIESGSAHRLDVVILSVALLDGTQLVGKRRNLFWRGQYNPRQHSHPDCVIGSGLRIGGLDVPGAADAVGEFLQGCGITHFLHGQHMRVHSGDGARQCIEFGVVFCISLWRELAGREQVFQVPGPDPDNHDTAPFAVR